MLKDLVLSILVSLDRNIGFDLVEVVVEGVAVDHSLVGVAGTVDHRGVHIRRPNCVVAVVDNVVAVVVVVVADFVAQDTSWACHKDPLLGWVACIAVEAVVAAAVVHIAPVMVDEVDASDEIDERVGRTALEAEVDNFDFVAVVGIDFVQGADIVGAVVVAALVGAVVVAAWAVVGQEAWFVAAGFASQPARLMDQVRG